MEALLTLLYAVWEFAKMAAYMFWEIITLIPEAIGLPWWAVGLTGAAVIIIMAIPIIKKFLY